jgi:hypothetical protein
MRAETHVSVHVVCVRVVLTRPSPEIEVVTADHQSASRRNRSTNQIFCIRQMPEETCEHNATVHRLFIDLEKNAYG